MGCRANTSRALVSLLSPKPRAAVQPHECLPAGTEAHTGHLSEEIQSSVLLGKWQGWGFPVLVG